MAHRFSPDCLAADAAATTRADLAAAKGSSGEESAFTEFAILDGGRSLRLRAGGRSARFHAIWLRDNASDGETRSPQNGQRLIAVQDLPAATAISAAGIRSGRLHITFSPESRTLDYDITWLFDNAYDRPPPVGEGWTGPEIETWERDSMPALPPTLTSKRCAPIPSPCANGSGSSSVTVSAGWAGDRFEKGR